MSLTAGTMRRTSSESQDSMPPPTGLKCATVTMMLAERIARSDWSVDDEHFFETNTMNVWQTLEYLSGISLRKRYNYEGYADAQNVIRTLTPSWRRDSFADKGTKSPDESSVSGVKYTKHERNGGVGNDGVTTVAGGGGTGGGNQQRVSSANQRGGITPNNEESTYMDNYALAHTSVPRVDKKSQSAHGKRRRSRVGRKKKRDAPNLDAEYALSASDLHDLVKCTFNLPRISARLERLMGTNVVKLTDRSYMKELRERIDEDYRKQLQSRIKAREMKEVERERLLIIEGKTNVIPDELADDPIFMVNKDANVEIQKERAKLKTSREKNAERLKQQGVKWERERLQHAAKEAELLQKKKERQRQQKMLVEQYRQEDAERGMDLLRIDNEDWRECEQSLKEFLERERTRMKERSMLVPTQFTSDPKDIQNIVRARQKFRETEQRIRQELEAAEQQEKKSQSLQNYQDTLAKKESEHSLLAPIDHVDSVGDFETESYQERMRRRFIDDATDISDESLITEEMSSLSVAKRRYAAELEEEMENEVSRGLLISKTQYDQLRFEDEKILALRNAQDIRELYQLAEEIIMGEIIEEVEEEEEEGVAEEEAEPELSDH